MLVLDSAIHSVTVHRSGAVVTRVAEVDASSGADLAIEGLPLSLEDGSVRVEVLRPDDDRPPPQPSDVRVVLALPEPERPPSPPVEALEEARRRLRSLQARLERIGAEDQLFRRVQLSLAPASGKVAPQAVPVEAWLRVAAWVEEQLARRVTERADLRREQAEVREELARLERAEAAARATRGPDEHEVSKRVLVRLRGGEGEGRLVLKLEYQVPGARWRPSYVLRVARDGSRAEVGVRALVAQSSGEPWGRTRLALSTADLRRDTSIPELRSLRLGRAQPPALRRAWREPPKGSEGLFRDLDAALAGMAGGAAMPPATVDPFYARRPAEPELEELEELELFDSDAGVSFSLDADPFAGGPPPTGSDPFGGAPPPPPGAPPSARAASVAPPPAQAFDPFGDSSSFGAPAPSAPPPPRAKMAKRRSARGGGPVPLDPHGALGMLEGGGGGPAAPPPPIEHRPGELDYGRLVLDAWDAPRDRRGRLRPLGVRDQLSGLDDGRARSVAQLLDDARRRAGRVEVFPPETCDVAASSGAFDYKYTAASLVDIPSDGQVHNVPLLAREAPCTLSLIVVPLESDQAVRVASLENPLDAPLLQGPAEVYLDEEFLVETPLRTVPAGGRLEVGLGVEEGLKVARNTHFQESSRSRLLASGRTILAHRVEIEVASRLSSRARVEVRERVPVGEPDDDAVAVSVTGVEPAWEDYDQGERRALRGGKRWRLELEAGASRKLVYSYEVQIDAKKELVGGNRRD